MSQFVDEQVAHARSRKQELLDELEQVQQFLDLYTELGLIELPSIEEMAEEAIAHNIGASKAPRVQKNKGKDEVAAKRKQKKKVSPLPAGVTYRDVVLMHATTHEKFTITEVCKQRGLPRSSVKTAVQQALKAEELILSGQRQDGRGQPANVYMLNMEKVHKEEIGGTSPKGEKMVLRVAGMAPTHGEIERHKLGEVEVAWVTQGDPITA